MDRRGFLLGIAASAPVALAGAAPVPAAKPDFFETVFEGLAIGRGRIRSGIVGLDRGFLVWTTGRHRGRDFELDQLFRFDDGKTDRRIWRFHRVAQGRWLGERQDLAGPATVWTEGGAVRLSYDILMRPAGRLAALRLHCEDRVTRLASGALLSRGTIHRLGLPVGTVEAHLIPRAGGAATSAPRRSAR
ncbi:DUF3833 family protein [Kaistia geumhonensis]|uniref:DUF3833 family protein n=1 Tax=Kaistia geumhonensis TaxID=410839 RepID=A0ABU0M697_9HYPH|nr:DUF3833 family protein [Kaistia geumhonensis]MCX5478295.1 DUF3833 family protein [Kaistia geumhonensis]MDQ0516488.1 hypothetical protein [Kaistia geumhonensis]